MRMVKYSWNEHLASSEDEFNAKEAEEMVPMLLAKIAELQDDNFRLHARLVMAYKKIEELKDSA